MRCCPDWLVLRTTPCLSCVVSHRGDPKLQPWRFMRRLPGSNEASIFSPKTRTYYGEYHPVSLSGVSRIEEVEWHRGANEFTTVTRTRPQEIPTDVPHLLTPLQASASPFTKSNRASHQSSQIIPHQKKIVQDTKIHGASRLLQVTVV